MNHLDLEEIANDLIIWATTRGIKLLIGGVALVIGWKIIKNILKIMNTTLEKRSVDITLLSFLDAFVNIALKLILLVVVMGYVGIETASIAAMIASAGLAVGLALQGSLSNFAGGVIILLVRPFNVGDFVEASGYAGVVEKISIFHTYLATPDNKQILIPNGNLANGSIINYSVKELRRVDLTFSVSYGENIAKVKSILNNIIERHELIIKEPEPFVGVSAHKDSSIELVVKVWCNNLEYWNIYHGLLEEVKIKFDEENIEIPYPQMDVHLKNNEN